MTVRLHVQNDSQVIVPLRFERAIRGKPLRDAPEPDDRGYVMNPPSGFSTTTARGPMVGVTVGDTVRLKATREDLDAGAPLFATVSDSPEPQVEIAAPAGGGPLPADGVFSVRGLADNMTGQTIQIRLGSATGPVLTECEAHVFEVRTLLVTPHVVTVHAAATEVAGGGFEPVSDAEVADIFTIAKAIWRPAGVHLDVAAIKKHAVLNALADDTVLRWNSTLSNGAPVTNSLGNVTALGWDTGRCNVYFVAYVDRSLGIGLRFETMSSESQITRPACTVATFGSADGSNFNQPWNFPQSDRPYLADHAHWLRALGNDTAHEIGHFLSLTHAGNVNAVAGTSTPNGREDTYSRRQLMHPHNLLTPSGTGNIRTTDVGYGAISGGGHRGCMLTLKNHPQFQEDGEVKKARDRLLHANLYRHT